MPIKTSMFDYQLPEELIAQFPPLERGNSRMLVMDRKTGEAIIRNFKAITEYLKAGDLLVFNDTKVINARMHGHKNGKLDAAKIEILLMAPITFSSQQRWECLIKPGKRVPPGSRVQLLSLNGSLQAENHWFTVTERTDGGSFIIEFDTDNFELLQNDYGHVPLPPYIKRGDQSADRERYQTVYAQNSGAVAAPTAGLHLTETILAELKKRGVNQTAVTLHVGAGTFKPVSTEYITEHQMHSERYELSEQSANLINRTRESGGRVLAVGTTSVRVLESCAQNGLAMAGSGSTEIFIYPPRQMQLTDILLTNFHLPKSTLLMLVSAFSTREKVLAAYELAIKEQMRFFSYGDCMLLI